jgi:Co/Zn/Cd efflux system component
MSFEAEDVSDSCCQIPIDTSALQVRQRRVLTIVLVINAATFLMMVTATIVSGSSSLLSGALDNFGDAVTYALSFAVVGAASAAKARVALFKGLMILGAALAVAFQIGWRILHPETPIVETMGVAALLNLGANLVCLRLLMPYRDGDLNMASAWECSRNDVMEGFAVIVTTVAVWAFASGWPDVVVATALLILFLRSAVRVLGAAWRELYSAAPTRRHQKSNLTDR